MIPQAGLPGVKLEGLNNLNVSQRAVQVAYSDAIRPAAARLRLGGGNAMRLRRGRGRPVLREPSPGGDSDVTETTVA